MMNEHKKNQIIEELYKDGYILTPCDGKETHQKGWPNLTFDASRRLYKNGEFKNKNVAIVCGENSGLSVIDCDAESAKEIVLKIQPDLQENSTIVSTSGAKRHYYCKFNNQLRNLTKAIVVNNKKIDVDIRSQNGYCVCPPSVHPDTGETYKFIQKGEHKKINDDLLSLLTRRTKLIYTKTLMNEDEKTQDDVYQEIKNLSTNQQMALEMNGLLIVDNCKSPSKKTESIKSNTNFTTSGNDKLSEISKIINLLDENFLKDKICSYSDWMSILFLLKNECGNDGLKLIKKLSEKYYEFYDENEHDEKWETIKDNVDENQKITIGTLYHWLKQQNPKEYNKIMKEKKAENRDYQMFADLDIENTVTNRYDLRDTTYYWNDFKNEWKNEKFVIENKKEMSEIINKLKNDLVRVYAKIEGTTKTATSIIKLNKGNPIHIFDGYPDINIYFVLNGKNITKSLESLIRHEGKFYKDLEYTSFCFKPHKENTKDRFNIFQGFKAKYDKEYIHNIDKIQAILDHIYYVYSGSDKDWYEYILTFFQHILIKPHQKIGRALLLYSKTEGTGKNILINFIQSKVIGNAHCLNTEGLDRILSRFNAHLENKLLICCNELASHDGRTNKFNKLKGLLTEKKRLVEHKGLNGYKIKDLSNYVFTTNNIDSVYLNDKDRRFLVPPLSECKANNEVYFQNLLDSFTQENANYFFSYLVDFKSTKNLFKKTDIPESKIKNQIVDINKNSIEIFFEELPNIPLNTLLVRHVTIEKNDKHYIKNLDLYSIYRKACERYGKHATSYKKFIQEVKSRLKNKRIRKDGKNISVTELPEDVNLSNNEFEID